MGASADRVFDDINVHLSLARPSHLEIVDPVVVESERSNSKEEIMSVQVLGVLLHGDAAFAGQVLSAKLLLSRRYAATGLVEQSTYS